MHRVALINGPNLNLLGTREPTIYGSTTFPDLMARCQEWGEAMNLEVAPFQSNHEGAIIDRIHEVADDSDGIVINPGAYGHTSYAIHDALTAVGLPAVEVHISNIRQREPWRRSSVTAPAAIHAIYGRGVTGYRDALSHLANRWRFPPETVPYGDHPDQFAEVRTPHGPGPRHVVLLVHGGFWRHHFARDLMDGLAVDLAERGFASWNVEYRRMGEGGGGTETTGDVRLAVRAAAAHPDTERLTVVGHEAGAILALNASAPAEVALCVTMSGITDLLAARQDRLGDDAAGALLGGSPPEALSPIHRLPLGLPVVLFHGDRDTAVPISHGIRYAETARAAGDTAELVTIDGADGSSFLDPRNEAWTRVVSAIET
ncbi:MAG: type II 3-dehydroquinate dehydratase [Acidimicrobiia bacterium]|nr:type II 3-dehydroquinate dehydratase [Acidimicrobiia bacterium]